MSDLSEELEAEIAEDQAKLAKINSHLVTLRHPLTGDVQQVESKAEKMIPWMGKGYVQVKEHN